MEEPKLSPFKLTQSRIILLVFGVLVLLIGISTAMGGLNSYQELKGASAAAQNGESVEPASTPTP